MKWIHKEEMKRKKMKWWVLTSTPPNSCCTASVDVCTVCSRVVSSFSACCLLASVNVWRSRTVSLDVSFSTHKTDAQTVCREKLTESGCDLCWNQTAGLWPKLLSCPYFLSVQECCFLCMRGCWDSCDSQRNGRFKIKWKDTNKMFYDQY